MAGIEACYDCGQAWDRTKMRLVPVLPVRGSLRLGDSARLYVEDLARHGAPEVRVGPCCVGKGEALASIFTPGGYMPPVWVTVSIKRAVS